MHAEFAAFAVSAAIGSAALTLALLMSLRYKLPVLRRAALFHAALLLMTVRLGLMSYTAASGFGNAPGIETFLSLAYIPSATLFSTQGILLIRVLAGRPAGTGFVIALYAISTPLSIIAAFSELKPFDVVADNIVMWGAGLYIIVYSFIRFRNLVKSPWRDKLLALLGVSVLFIGLSFPGLFGLSLPFADFYYPVWFAAFSAILVLIAFDAVLVPPKAREGLPQGFSRSIGLSPRETEVAALLLDGLTTKEIAERLYISTKTVENHLSSIYAKARAKNRFEFFTLARSGGAWK
jgi:DNA-binding CsgD family transcriptional regulator